MGVGDRHHLIPGSAFETDFGDGRDLALIANLVHGFDAPAKAAGFVRVAVSLVELGRNRLVIAYR